MSNRREDNSRPGGNETSQRNTARDVPAAKYKESSVGTVAPAGLRGPSLLPGQGAPERIVPEEIELAVLRDAETMDGPNVARVKRLPAVRLSLPTPVPVEVPRARSAPPPVDDYSPAPSSPSARSIQSGTLMSMGSVDPRAPTELSLPSPRPLSVSERAAYLGPEAVVDRTPAQSLRELPGVVESGDFSSTEGPTKPNSWPLPSSGTPSVPRGSGSDASAPQLPARTPASRPVPSSTPSTPDLPPRFQIHSELASLLRDFKDDTFDLRSASTVREPLAGRRPLASSGWTPHAPPTDPRAAEPEPGARTNRHSSPAVTILVDREHAALATEAERPAARRRATVPVSWVLGAGTLALVLALLLAWLLRATAPSEAAREADRRASIAAPSAAPLPAPAVASPPAVSQNTEPRAPGAVLRSTTATHASPTAKAAVRAIAPGVPQASGEEPAPPDADARSKHQSIY